MQGAQSLVDLVIQRGFRGRISSKDTKNDMRADHKAIIFEAARVFIPHGTERNGHKMVLMSDLQEGMIEMMMVNEIGLYSTGDGDRGPKDVLQKVIFSNMPREQTGRRERRCSGGSH